MSAADQGMRYVSHKPSCFLPSCLSVGGALLGQPASWDLQPPSSKSRGSSEHLSGRHREGTCCFHCNTAAFSRLAPIKAGRARHSLCGQILFLVGTEAPLGTFQGVTSDPRPGICGWSGQPPFPEAADNPFHDSTWQAGP